MIRKLFNQKQIIKAISRHQKENESTEVILNSIKELNWNKYPLEAILVLQWILESLIKKILENNNLKCSNIISKNLKAYFKNYPNTLLDKRKIQDILDIRNNSHHYGKIRDSRMYTLINSYILAIEFIAMEANIDLNHFIPPSSTEQIKAFAKENQLEIEEEEEKKKKKSYLKYWFSIPLTLGISFFLYKYYNKITILTGAEDGTYYKMFQQLQDYESNIEVITSEGSGATLKILGENRDKEQFGLVQQDVLKKFAEDARKGKKLEKRILKNIYVVEPILKEEIYILVKEDSNLTYFKDIEDKKIAIGLVNSGNAVTAQYIYKSLFNKELKHEKYDKSFSESLYNLKYNNIDAIIMVGGEPLARLKRLKGVKFLSFQQKKAPVGYEIGDIKKENYPWLKSDKRTLLITSFLVTNIADREKVELLPIVEKLKKSLENNPNLKIHQKWKEFPTFHCLPILPNGIVYHSATRLDIEYCGELNN
jgi:TRAP-type uncharacterized transport system substrate-binding protein